MSDQRPTLKAVGAPRAGDALYSAFMNARATFWSLESLLDIAIDRDLAVDYAREILIALHQLAKKADAEFEILEQRFGELEEQGRAQ